MEKRGVIDENTPAERPGGDRGGPMPTTKEAADRREDNAQSRLADAAARVARAADAESLTRRAAGKAQYPGGEPPPR